MTQCKTVLMLAATTFSVMAFAARAEMMKFTADMKGASEVPATPSKGTGKVDAALDSTTKKLTYTITYSDLTGPVTAAHFHGPAAAGANAGPIVPLSGDMKSPIKGEATLTDAQIKEMTDGKVYINLHTAAHKDGELRGQVMKN